eukprot:281108-Pelagomonas_calceolata.AAC.7
MPGRKPEGREEVRKVANEGETAHLSANTPAYVTANATGEAHTHPSANVPANATGKAQAHPLANTQASASADAMGKLGRIHAVATCSRGLFAAICMYNLLLKGMGSFRLLPPSLHPKCVHCMPVLSSCKQYQSRLFGDGRFVRARSSKFHSHYLAWTNAHQV